MKLITFTDGGSRGNPGPSALGVVIKDAKGKTIESFGTYLGKKTNNYAEYMALVSALTRAHVLKATTVSCFLDSELIVKQMRGQYRVKNPDMLKLFSACSKLVSQFESVSFTHIPREKNKEADAEVNKSLDIALYKRT